MNINNLFFSEYKKMKIFILSLETLKSAEWFHYVTKRFYSSSSRAENDCKSWVRKCRSEREMWYNNKIKL